MFNTKKFFNSHKRIPLSRSTTTLLVSLGLMITLARAANGPSLPKGWEETVVDEKPYYANKSGQPWTSADGVKVPHGEGTHTRPTEYDRFITMLKCSDFNCY